MLDEVVCQIQIKALVNFVASGTLFILTLLLCVFCIYKIVNLSKKGLLYSDLYLTYLTLAIFTGTAALFAICLCVSNIHTYLAPYLQFLDM